LFGAIFDGPRMRSENQEVGDVPSPSRHRVAGDEAIGDEVLRMMMGRMN